MSDDNNNSDTDTGDRIFNIPDQNATPRTLRRAVGDAQKLLGDVLRQNKQLQAAIDQDAANKPRGKGKGKGKTSVNPESGASGPNSLGYHSVITNLGKSFSILVFPFIDAGLFSAKVAPPLIHALDLWKPNPMSAELPRYLTAAIYAHVPEKYHPLIDRSNFPDFANNFIRQANAQRSTSLNTIKTYLTTLLATLMSDMKDIHNPLEWQALVLFPGEPEGEEISGFPPILYPNLVKNPQTVFKNTVLTQALRCLLFGPASMNGAVPGSAVLGRMWNVQKVTFGAMSLVSLLVIFQCYWRARLLRNPDEKVEKLEVIGSTSKVGWQEIYLRLRRGLESRAGQPFIWSLQEFWHQEVFAGISVPSVARPQRAFVRDEDAELEEAMGAIDLGPDNQDAWNDMDDVRAVAPFRQGSIAAAPPTRRTNRELEPAQGVRLRQPGPSRQTGPPPRHVQPETLGGSANTSRRLAPGIGDSYADFQAGAGPRHQASGYRIPVPAPRIPVPAPRIPVPAPRRWPAQNDYDSRHEFEVQVRLGGAGAGSRRLPGGAAAVLQQNEEGVHGQDRHHRTVHRGTPEPAFRRPLQHDASDSDASNGDPYDDDESVSFDDHHHSTIRRGAPEPSLRRPPQHEAYDDDDDVNLSFDQVQHGHHHRTVHRGAPEPSLHRPPQHEAYDDDVNLSFDPAQHDRRHRTIHHGPPEPVLRRPAQNFAGNDSYDSMDDKADNMDNGKNHSIGLSQDRGRSYQFAAAAPVLQRRPAAPVLQRRPADSGDDEDFPIGVGQDQGDHATVFSRRHAQEQGSTHESLTASSRSAATVQDVGEDSEVDESLSAPIRRPMPKRRSRTMTRIENDPEPEEEVQHMPPVQPAVLTEDEMRQRLTVLKVTQLRAILFDVKAKISSKAVKADLVQLVMENEKAMEVYRRLYTLA